MNVTSWLAAVRRYFDDDAKRKFTDQDLITNGDLEARSIFRTFTRSSEDWHNCIVFLDPTNAVQLGQNIFQWRLPTWVQRISAVYRRESVAIKFPGDPYRTPNTGAKLLEKVEKSDDIRRRGWDWDGNHSLTWWGETSAPYVALKVAKIPHRMFRAVIATTDTGAAAQLILPPNIVGELELEGGAYVNAEVEIVAAASRQLGEVRRCIWSSPNEVLVASTVFRLFFDAAFPFVLAPNDVVETRLPVPQDFALLHVLRTVQATLPKKPNMELLRVIAPRLQEEEKKLIEYATPHRDMTGPFFKQSRMKQRNPRNPDIYPPYLAN